MVTWFAHTLRDTCWSAHLLAQTTTDQAAPLITQLDPPSRTKVIMALVGIALVGLSLLSLIVMLGRRARRLARKSWARPAPVTTIGFASLWCAMIPRNRRPANP